MGLRGVRGRFGVSKRPTPLNLFAPKSCDYNIADSAPQAPDSSQKLDREPVRVLLLAANTLTEPYPVLPIGLLAVARALRQDGQEVFFHDCLQQGADSESLSKSLELARPQVIGISLRNIDSTDSQNTGWVLDKYKRIIETLRSLSTAPVMVGGAGFSIMPELILDHLGADCGVVGEGEELAPVVSRVLADRGAGLADGSGSVAPLRRLWRQEHLKHWERDLPGTTRGLEQERPLFEYYQGQGGLVGVQSKRGCPYKCLYCTYPQIEGHRLRARQAGAVTAELEYLKKNHGLRNFYFTDSVFNDDAGHWLELLEDMVRKKLDLGFAAYFRPARVGREEMKLAQRAGLMAIESGLDSSSAQTMRCMKKPFIPEEVLEFQEICVDLKIPVGHFVIFGGPGETDSTLEDGLKFVTSIPSCVIFAGVGIRVFPGSGIHDLMRSEARFTKSGSLSGYASGNLSHNVYGHLYGHASGDAPGNMRDVGMLGGGSRVDYIDYLDEKNLLKPFFYFAEGFDLEKGMARINQSFKGRRTCFFPPEAAGKRTEVLRRLGYSGLLWPDLIRFDAPERASRRSKAL